MNRRNFLLSALLCATLSFAAPWQPLGASATGKPGAKNVIIMIPDGTGHAGYTLARQFSGAPLFLDHILRGATQTASANSVVTDSAAAGTALATMTRTNNGMVGLSPDKDPRPLVSITELAQSMGKAVGVVTTDELFGATPGAFSAHAAHRSEGSTIIRQQVYQGFDVMMGGGRRLMKPENRPDKEDLIAAVKEQGYTYAATAEEMKAVDQGKLWGCFNDGGLTPMVTRLARDVGEPTLKEMTEKAIEILSKNPNGFVLMVEGAQADWGNHSHDAIYATHEILAFDAAVQAACAFAAKTPGTIVLATPDHETGGLTLPKTKADRIGTMKQMKLAAKDALKGLKSSASDSEITAAVRAHWNIKLSESDMKAIRKLINDEKRGLVNTICRVVSTRHLGLDYTSTDHTGVDVPYWGFGLGLPTGTLLNTDIPRTAAAYIGGDFQALAKTKYVKVENPETDLSDKANPVLVLKGRRIPADKNFALTADGKKEPLGGLAVYIRTTKTWYLPAEAL